MDHSQKYNQEEEFEECSSFHFFTFLTLMTLLVRERAKRENGEGESFNSDIFCATQHFFNSWQSSKRLLLIQLQSSVSHQTPDRFLHSFFPFHISFTTLGISAQPKIYQNGSVYCAIESEGYVSFKTSSS